jgi:hypothetical protein
MRIVLFSQSLLPLITGGGEGLEDGGTQSLVMIKSGFISKLSYFGRSRSIL